MKYAVMRIVHHLEGGSEKCSLCRVSTICLLDDRAADHHFKYASVIEREEVHKVLEPLGITIEQFEYAPRHTEGNQ